MYCRPVAAHHSRRCNTRQLRRGRNPIADRTDTLADEVDATHAWLREYIAAGSNVTSLIFMYRQLDRRMLIRREDRRVPRQEQQAMLHRILALEVVGPIKHHMICRS